MRLLQVPTGSGEVIDLHPAVSVVTGLTAEQRQALIDVVAGLPAGEARGAGLVEAHDVLFDLDDDVLDLFELGDQPVDPVVGPGAHLGHDGDDPTGSEALDAARGEVDQARSSLDAAADALAAATTARDVAAAAVAACTAAVDEADDGPDGEHGEAAASGPNTDLEAARRRLEAAEVAALAAQDAASRAEEAADADATAGLRSRRDDLESRQTELVGLVTVLDDDLADEVIELLAELDGPERSPAEHDPRALELADEITALVEQLEGLPAAQPVAPSLETAHQRLDRARAALEEAEAARDDPPPDDAALAVERAHEELLDALDEAERRFRRARAQRRVEEARAAEQAALAELGHNSYTDFLTGGAPSTRSDGSGQVDAARAELAAAEEAVAEATATIGTEQRRTEVREQLADALDRAEAVVGRPLRDEPLRVARALRTVVAEPPDRRDDLVSALCRAGVALTDAAGDGRDAPNAPEDPGSEPDVELDLADLEVLARALVDEAQTNAVRRRTALAELAEVESELSAVEVRLAAPGTTGSGSSTGSASSDGEEPDGPSPASLDDDPEVRSAREAVRAAEAAMAVAAEQADARASAQDRLAVAGSAELAATEEQAAARAALDHAEAALAAAEAELADAEADALATSTTASTTPAEVAAVADPAPATYGDDDDPAAGGPASLEWYVLSRMAAQRAVSYVGGLPLVLDRTLDSLDPAAVSEVLGRLEPTTSAVQLIVFTESEGALRWAEAVGPDRAAVVRPGPAAR